MNFVMLGECCGVAGIPRVDEIVNFLLHNSIIQAPLFVIVVRVLIDTCLCKLFAES